MGNAAPGAQLGVAQGSIRIDTSDLQRISAVTQQVGQTAARNLAQINTGAQRAQSGLSRLAGVADGLLPAFGLAAGAGLVAQMGRVVMQSDAMATAYRRQSVAALSLAGSQDNLNELLETYNRVTGGAIDKAQALGDVTRLQAVGFADSAEELEQFAIAARGISVAMGVQQDYVIGQLQLAIANQSKMRLDQIGLGVGEVTQRIKALKAADSTLTEEMAYQNAVLGIALEKYGALATSAEAQATGAEKASKAWKELQLQIGETAGPVIGEAMTELANKLDQVAQGFRLISSLVGQLNKQLASLGFEIPPWLSSALRTNIMGGLTGGISSLPSAIGGITSYFTGEPPTTEQPRRRRSTPTPQAVPAGPSYTDDQTAAIRQWARDVADIERQAAAARIDATRQYEQQRIDTIRNYGKSIAREEEDFARNRARAIRDFDRQYAQVQAAAAEREAAWQREYNERIANLRADGNERLTELEANYNRNRERAQRDHRDRLLDAAARLDAVAIRNEQRNYARQQQDAEENYTEQRDKIKEALAEQLADAQQAQEQRLKEARQADADRLADMRAAFDERLAQEDEERAIQRARRAEDHADQMAEMDRAQAERMAKISEQEAQEKQSRQEAFVEQLNDLGLHNTHWLTIQQAAQKESLRLFDEFWTQFNDRINGQIQGPVTEDQAWPTRFVVPQNTPVAQRGGAGGNRNITIQSGAITVNGAPGQSEERIGQIVRNEMIGLLEGVQ